MERILSDFKFGVFMMMADSIMDLTTRRAEAPMTGKPRAAKSVFSIRSLVEVEEDSDLARRPPGGM